MKDTLTEKESIIADKFLIFLLTLDKNSAFKSIVNTFFEKHKLNKNRGLFVCKYLERKNLVTVMLDTKDELRNLTFDIVKIKDFIKNEGVNKIWLTENKLYNDSKLSERQVKTFYIVFVFGLFGGLYSCYDFIKTLNTKEYDQSKQITKEELELELSKLRTLILNQKKDSLLNTSNSEKGK
ncbi:hypothetical protein [Flavobacterium sp.]|jgi:hypothetical protein|uniref:hypothetical protein n=1 Tax=Flavobacterium sp. TaxID=239 RepID=UPI0037BFEC83